MPKRLIDGEALWGSTKLAECPEWMIPEYAWFYPLADSKGCFELTNPRVILFQVGAIRPHLTLDVVKQILNAFHHHGLLFLWSEGSKTFGYWTGSDQPGRLPKPSHRDRYTNVQCTIPKKQLEHYLANIPSRSRPGRSQLPLVGDVPPGDGGVNQGPGQGGVESRLGPDGLALAVALGLPLVSLSRSLRHAKDEEARASETPSEAPAKLPSSRELHEEAKRNLDERIKTAKTTEVDEQFRIAAWHRFKERYPNKRDEEGARIAFFALSEIDMELAIEAVQVWQASSSWQEGDRWIPKAKNWLASGDFRQLPPTVKEKANGRPDPNTRTERNLEALGVTSAKVARNSS